MTTVKSIDNSQDVIDSREVIERIDYLAYLDDEPEAERDEDDWKELQALRALAEEAEGYAADWKYGEALIRESYFTEYARELAEDIGAVKDDATWPNNCIDWDEAARLLKQDYTTVDFDGVDYYIR